MKGNAFRTKLLTKLIPGIFRTVPITGTLRKKFTATGKKPLKTKIASLL